ncbi:hypothetical protein BR93DRAFT_935213 [Coniochaeta sp. PMI_546]|nr:hypothetical protein BR93DRAFT_935213 [Coniochaeta sp. PMI_546]
MTTTTDAILIDQLCNRGPPYYSHQIEEHAAWWPFQPATQLDIPVMETGVIHPAGSEERQHAMLLVNRAEKRRTQGLTRSRASNACLSCRNLKTKCDETTPCSSCKKKKLECKYDGPKSKHANLESTANARLELIETMVSEIHRSVVTGSDLRGTFLEKPVWHDQADKTEVYVESFRRHMEALSPLIMPDELHDIMSSFHDTTSIQLPAKRKRSEEAEWNHIIALLVLALGASCLPGLQKLGQTYVDDADSLMDSLQDTGASLNFIRANTLMALYSELFGCRGKTMNFFANAGNSLQRLSRSSFAYLEGRESAGYTPEENDFLFAYWNFLMMDKYGSVPLLCAFADRPRDLCVTRPDSVIFAVLSDSMPYPDGVVARHRGLSEDVLHDFLRRLSLHRRRNQGAVEARSGNWRTSLDMITAIEPLFNLTQVDLDVVNASPLPANIPDLRFRASYFNMLAYFLTPFALSICERSSEPDAESTEHARQGIIALTRSIEALCSLPKELLVIPNIVSLAYSQMMNLLLLGECHRSNVLRKYISTEYLTGLLHQSILFFDAVSAGPSSVTVNLAILAPLRVQLRFPEGARIDLISRVACHALQVDDIAADSLVNCRESSFQGADTSEHSYGAHSGSQGTPRNSEDGSVFMERRSSEGVERL